MQDQFHGAKDLARFCIQAQLFDQAGKLVRAAKYAIGQVEVDLTSFELEGAGIPFKERFLVPDYSRLLTREFERVRATTMDVVGFVETWSPVLDGRLAIFDVAFNTGLFDMLGHQNEISSALSDESPHAGSLDDITRQRRCRALASILNVRLARLSGYLDDFEFEIRSILLGQLYELPPESTRLAFNRPLIRVSDVEALEHFFENAEDDDYERFGVAVP